jgi:hypothetical protein
VTDSVGNAKGVTSNRYGDYIEKNGPLLRGPSLLVTR